MKKTPNAILAIVSAACTSSAQESALPFEKGWELQGDDTKVEPVQGRSALRMRTGRAIERDVRFQDGPSSSRFSPPDTARSSIYSSGWRRTRSTRSFTSALTNPLFPMRSSTRPSERSASVHRRRQLQLRPPAARGAPRA